MSATIPDELENVPGTARLIWLMLSVSGPLTRAELVERTATPHDTVGAALTRLKHADHIESYPDPKEPRRYLYETAKNCTKMTEQ